MSARKYREDQEFVSKSINTTANEERMDFGINSEDGNAVKAPPTPQQIRQILAKKPKKVRITMRQKWKWVALFLISIYAFGLYYCIDGPAALQSSLQKQFDIGGSEYALLYSVYSTPNLIIPLFGGLLIDRMGLRLSVLVFMSFVVCGQLIFAIGGATLNYSVMLLGRFVYGIGCESAFFAQVAFAAKWFMDGNLNVASGVINSFPLWGSLLNGIVTPRLYGSTEDPHLGRSLFMGFYIMLICFACLLVLTYIDKKADDELDEIQREKTAKILRKLRKKNKEALASFTEGELTDLESEFEDNEAPEDHEDFKCSDIKELGFVFWLNTLICLFVQSAIMVYIQFVSELLEVKYGFDKDQAGQYIAIPYTVNSIISPFIGLLIDQTGNRLSYGTFGIFLCLLAHVIEFNNGECTHGCDWALVPLFVLGFSNSLYLILNYSSIIAYICQPQTLGTAYGITVIMQNVGLLVFPLIIGSIKDATSDFHFGYYYVSAFFIFMSSMAFLFSMLLLLYDYKYQDSLLQARDPYKIIKQRKFEQAQQKLLSKF